jgi:hypothetical protein
VANAKAFTVVGAFQGRAAAESAIEELRKAGFGNEDIGIAVREEAAATASTPAEKGNRLDDMAAAGAAAGGTIGALAGAIATGLIPGMGQVVAAGLLAGIVGGTLVGAATGGLVGALIGLGIPEEDARYYDREFLAGGAVVAVRAPGRSKEVAEILRRHAAYSVSTAAERRAAAAPSATARQGTKRAP